MDLILNFVFVIQVYYNDWASFAVIIHPERNVILDFRLML